MDEVESYDIVFLVKELRLAVKFPCRLTLQHSGRTISPEIQSSGSNVFPLNRDIAILEDKKRDFLELNVNLTTDKGGNIMAGIIKINLKDLPASEGQTLTLSLQKCLDPYATCHIMVKSVKVNRSRVRKGTLGEDWKAKNDNKFESKSDAPVMDIRSFKPRSRYGQLDHSFGNKRVNITTLHSPNVGLKEKAVSMAGFRPVTTSFDRDMLASRFKHLGRKDQDQNKSMPGGKWRDVDQTYKATIQANEKTLKLEIVKYKTKYEQSQRNLEQKTKQIKTLKDQLGDLNRQLTEKHFLVQQLNSKNSHISKLEQANRSMSKQLHEERNRLIDLERELDQQKNTNYSQMSRIKEDNDKKEHQFQKGIYEKKEQLKEILEENQYKTNQINRMKGLIEDLESSIESKTYEFEKLYSRQKSEHNKTKILLQQKISELTNQIKTITDREQEISQVLVKSQDQNIKHQSRIMILESTLIEQENKFKEETNAKEKQMEQKKRLLRVEEDLNGKIKNIVRELASKQKDLDQANDQINQLSDSSKKKLNQLLEKNKVYTSKIQELENKVNILTAQEDKLRRNLDMAQKQNKSLQENEKIISKNLKLKDQRILQMERQLTELESKTTMKDSLGKKQAEYKAIQLEKITIRVTELQKLYEKQKETSEDRRLQILKSENKVRMLQEGNARLNDQIKELKTSQIKREDEWMDKIKELKEQLKNAEEHLSENNKEIHNCEIEKINLKNQINKLEKLVDNYTQKCERIKKKQAELQNHVKSLTEQINSRNAEIIELESSYKILENDFKALQADKNKTEKITNIIKQQKVIAVGDINKLKKQIEQKQKKEQTLIQQIKKLKDQITHSKLKHNTTAKEFERFKTSVSQVIKNTFSLKIAYSSLESMSTVLENSRTILGRSRHKVNNDIGVGVDAHESKFVEAIQNYGRQSQQAIMTLSEEIKKTKKEKETLQKEYQSLNQKYKELQEDSEKRIIELANEIDTMATQNVGDIEEYEQKIMSIEKELKKKDKNINDLIEEIQELRAIQNNQNSAHQSTMGQLLSKIHSLKSKLADHEAKDEGNSTMFITLEQKLSALESQNTQLIHQNEVLSEQLVKKEKQNMQANEHIEDLVSQLQNIKKIKGDYYGQLLVVKENFTVEQQNLKRVTFDLREEENKNKQLKTFNNQLLKEKEQLIKKEIELTEKNNSFEEKVQFLMIELAEKSEDLSKRQTIISEYRQNVKEMHLQINNNQNIISETRLQLEREKQKVKERERKLLEKENEISSLSTQNKKIQSKFEAEVYQLKQQIDQLIHNHRKEQTSLNSKISDLELQIKKLLQIEKKLNENVITLQEQIFFQKQINSLGSSRTDDLQGQISRLRIEVDQLNQVIHQQSTELREKEQSLFALSGKLYTSDNRLQNKEEEFRARMQKLDLEWRYKLEQICEQYENKLDLMQRQKSYVKSGMQGYNQAAQRLEGEKIALKQDIERQREAWESKLKKAEEDKLISLIQKNRQIEKLREVFEQLQEKMKKKDFQLKALEEDKRKAEEKLKQFKSQNEKSEEKKNQTIRKLQFEADQLKRKQGQLKRFKEALKNNQWATERQIKKGIQNCAKSLVALAQEQSKDDVMNIMRNLETSIGRLACPNVDEL